MAADKYNIRDLVDICVYHLSANLTEENAVEIMTKSHMINQKKLFDASRKFVQNCKNYGKSVNTGALDDVKKMNLQLAWEIMSDAMFHAQK